MTGRLATPLEPVFDAAESAEVLDGVGKAVGKQVRSTIKQPLKDALSGTWLGHALHPLLTDVVIGTFLSATLLDLLGGDKDGKAGARLIAIGMAAYPVTALTGVNDWADTEPADDGIRRAGLIHAASNTTALAFYAGSRAARRNGARTRARAFSIGGAGALMFAGLLGGHLSFTKGVGPDQTVFDPGPQEWTSAGAASEIPEGELTRVVVDDTPVAVLRENERFYALHDRCSHRGCSLSDGSLDGDAIVCVCHGSRFDRRDGSVLQGPATAPQPAFEARVENEELELRRLT
jgi:nitrite reductase/ring-hydroxylating ferredoxin subunit